jgi:hypothetical protein
MADAVNRVGGHRSTGASSTHSLLSIGLPSQRSAFPHGALANCTSVEKAVSLCLTVAQSSGPSASWPNQHGVQAPERCRAHDFEPPFLPETCVTHASTVQNGDGAQLVDDLLTGR